MEYRLLGKTALRVSVLGFGASPLGDEFGKTTAEERQRAVDTAIDRGINYFDTSPFYGRTLSEERLGQALAGKRQRVFLATKCGRYDLDRFDFSAQRVFTSIDESLRRLRTDHVDVLQAHDIEFGDQRQIIEETVPALLNVKESGKARFIGVTGYPPRRLAEVAAARPLDLVLSYCHYNLLVTDMDELLTPLVREKGIGLVNASPLHMRILTETGAPAWHPAPESVKQAGAAVVRLCREHGRDPAAVALRFCIEHPYVATTLVGMASPAEVEANVRGIEQPVDAGLLEEIARLVEPVKNTTWESGHE